MNFGFVLLSVLSTCLSLANETQQLSHNAEQNDLQWSSHIDTPSINSSSIRFKRNANESFSTTVSRAQKIARLVNGIALRQGLTNGSINSDALISELLNLESVTPSDIKGLDATSLADLVKGIRDLPSLLIPGDDQRAGVEKIEKRYQLYASMLKKTEGIDKGFKIEKKDDYVKALPKFLNDFKDVKDLEKASKYLQNCLNDFIGLSVLNSSFDAHEVKNKFLVPASNIKIIKSIDRFKNLVSDSHLKNAEGTFKDLFNVRTAVQEFQDGILFNQYHSSRDDPYIKKFGEGIKILTALAEKSKTSLPSFERLIQIFVSRRPRNGNRIRSFSSGLRSPLDMNSIFRNLEDPWVNAAVGNTAELLSLALEPLKKLSSNTETLETTLVLSDRDSFKLFEVSKEVDKLSEYTEKFDLFLANINQAKLITALNDMEPANRDNFEKLRSNMLTLSKKLKAIETVIDVTSKLAVSGDHHSDFESVLAMINDTTEATSLRQLDILQKSQHFPKVLRLLKSAESSLTDLTDGNPSVFNLSPLKKSAEEVSKDMGQIDTYMQGLDVFFVKMDELRKVKGIDVIGDAVSAIKNYRNFTPTDLDFATVTSKLATANTALDDLEKTIGGFKSAKRLNLESENLMKLKNVLGESQTVGSATSVLSSIDSLATDKIVIDQKLIDLVKAKLSNLKDPQDKKNLELFTGPFNGELTNLYQGIDKMKTSFQSSTSSKLASLHSVFEEAKKIPGLSYDFRAIRNSLKKVQNLPQLDVVMKQLDSLESLGLDFASRQGAIDGSKKALEDLDLLFASYSKMMTPAVTPTLRNSGNGTSNAQPGALVGDEKTPQEPSILEEYKAFFIGGGIGVLLIIIALSGTLVYCCIKKKKEDVPDPDPYNPLINKNQNNTNTVGNKDKDNDGNTDNNKNDGRIAEEGKAGTTTPTTDTPAEKQVDKKLEDAPEAKGPSELQLDATQRLHVVEVLVINIGVLTKFIKKLSSDLMVVKNDNKKKWTKEKKTLGEVADWNLRKNFVQDHKTTLTNITESVRRKRKWMRHNQTLSPNNRVKLVNQGKFASTWFHGNMHTYPNGLRMIFMQGPQTRSDNPADPKECNIEMFYQMLMEQSSDQIVQLTKFEENGEVKCDVYIPTEKGQVTRFDFGLKVTCVELVKTFDDELETRDLLVEFEGKPQYSVKHYLYAGWPDHGAPIRTDVVIALLHAVRQNPNPVVVHCSAGIGRTGTFGIIESIYQTIATENDFHYGTALRNFRQTRANAVQDCVQYVYAYRCALDYIAANIDVNQLDEKERTKFINLSKQMEAAAIEATTKKDEADREAAEDAIKKIENQGLKTEKSSSSLSVEPTQMSYKEGSVVQSVSKIEEPGTSKQAEPEEGKKKSKPTKKTKGGNKKKKSKSKSKPSV